jgi:lipopolysaccharide biosynthesis protein
MQEGKVLVLAFYLPQFHPIPENNEWWGKGFTEWTNTAKARPLFKGHYQPHIPADLGFYDLRVPEVREAQAEMARDHGISGFCYWHYWFGNGQRLLERPFNEVLVSGKPDFPFCLAWANQSWTGVWHGLKDKVLIEQQYHGREDYINHFNTILPAFHDDRYLKIGNKPIFVVYSPQLVPDSIDFTSTWNELAIKNGFDGMYFIGIHYAGWDHKMSGYDDKTIHQPSNYIHVYEKIIKHRLRGIIHRNILRFIPDIYNYSDLVRYYDFNLFKDKDIVPTIIPGWDNTPRSGRKGWVFHASTPESFGGHFERALLFSLKRKDSKTPVLFIKSWNEWAEGNYLEPDQRYGMGYLEEIRKVMVKHNLFPH